MAPATQVATSTRFSLRSLFLLTALLSIACAFFATGGMIGLLVMVVFGPHFLLGWLCVRSSLRYRGRDGTIGLLVGAGLLSFAAVLALYLLFEMRLAGIAGMPPFGSWFPSFI